jgi:DNA-binding transcriptional ArsR family regulator
VTVRIERRDAYEFLLTVTTYTTPYRVDSYDVGQAWFERVDAALKPTDRATLHELAEGCEHVFLRLLNIAHDLPAPGSSAQLLDAVAAMDPADLRLTMLGYYSRRTRRRVAPEVIAAAAGGDSASARTFLAEAPDGPECVAALTGLLAADAGQLRARVMETLRGWDASVFRDHIAMVAPLLEREVDRLRRRVRELPERELLSEATGGADVVAEPGTEVIELFPQWVLRPWNVFWEHGTSQIIGVPIPPVHASANPDDPPDRLVALSKALGDERRLRILRRLTVGMFTLQELADHFEIPKTTLLHHLVILRSAGIVRVGPGQLGKYSLRAEMPMELHRLLDAYLPPVPATPVGTGAAVAASSRNGGR